MDKKEKKKRMINRLGYTVFIVLRTLCRINPALFKTAKSIYGFLLAIRTKTFLYFTRQKYLGSKQPVSKLFGFDRGEPIDRYYIEKFLSENKDLIRGIVVEVSESTYTHKFGGKNIEKSLILHVSNDFPGADIAGDLATGIGIPNEICDCFILTQTLPFIFEVQSAIYNSMRILKPGGNLLITVPGITQISRYDMTRWGHYWSFTDMSLRKLLEKAVPPENIKIKVYGNVKAATSFLYGLSQQEMSNEDLDFEDSDYQVTIAAVVKK